MTELDLLALWKRSNLRICQGFDFAKKKRATAIADSKAELPLEDTKQVESPPATAAMALGTLQSSGAKQEELVGAKARGFDCFSESRFGV